MPTVHKVRIPSRKPAAGLTAPNQGRENPNRDVYDTHRHRKERAAYLKQNPLCAECRKVDKTEPATVFDHIVPINQGGDPWAIENKQGLCKKCHQKKSAKERHKAKAQ